MASEIEQWAEYMQATGASAATIRLRLETMNHLTRHAGKTAPSQLDRRDVLAYLARPVKAWSKVTYWRAIRAWSVWAEEFGLIPESILRGIKAPRTPPPVARPIDDQSIARLLAAPISARAHAYVRLALFEGLRVHEVAQIRGEHFDRSSGWLIVVGKGGVTAPVPIHPEVAALAAHYPERGYWFPSPVDPAGHVQPRAVSSTIKHAMLTVGIHATAHRLRDSVATQLQREAHDLLVTQAFMRHASVGTTQKYVAIANSSLQQAACSLRWDAA